MTTRRTHTLKVASRGVAVLKLAALPDAQADAEDTEITLTDEHHALLAQLGWTPPSA